MQPKPKLITLQAITFLHPGTGQTTGIVDLPIQREVHTGHPMFAASGLKGSLRDKAEQLWGKDHADVNLVFGSGISIEEKSTAAGAISVTDARILAFPVRSLQEVFVWVICPLVIQRLLRDIGLIGLAIPEANLSVALDLMEANAVVATEPKLHGQLILEELNFTVTPNSIVDDIGNLITTLLDGQSGFDTKRLVIIPNDDFQHLVRYATQVAARISLNENKTTDGGDGNLWYEETLPPETLMYALALCHDQRKEKKEIDAGQVADKLQNLLKNKFLQIGGNETVGQGWCCVKVNGDKAGGLV